jgi:hypothetical protein
MRALKGFDWKDVLLIVGFASVVYGIYQLLPAAAYIVFGVALVWFSLFSERK